MKKYLVIYAILIIILSMAGCNKKEAKEEETSQTQTFPSQEETVKDIEEEVEEEKESIPKGHIKSRLTGLYVPEEIAHNRPYAIMLNNIKDANPQSGIEEASILYESLVEGGITRLMGIFENIESTRIGSVRSARQYFASIADEYDSILISFGESSYATEKIAELKIDQLSGLSGEGGKVFYRDSSIKAPHNAFASKEGILEGTRIRNYSRQYNKDLKNHFIFNDINTDLNSDKIANKVTLNYSKYTAPYFIYDKDQELYLRYQLGGEHLDANTNKQLTFKNLIIQFVNGFSIDETRSFSFRNGTGEGYYISNGKVEPISWEKDENTRKMIYYNSEKKILSMNPGKTYISIFPGNSKENVIFE